MSRSAKRGVAPGAPSTRGEKARVTLQSLVARRRSDGDQVGWGKGPPDGQGGYLPGKLRSDDEAAQVRALRAAGKSYTQIAAETGIPRSTCWELVRWASASPRIDSQ